jgi:hypothetical protein
MRKTILFLLLCVSLISCAQITAVHTISGPVTSNPIVIHLTHYGDKYVEVRGSYIYGAGAGLHHAAPDTILILNTDFSLFKRIILPDTSCSYVGLNSSYYAEAFGPGAFGYGGGIPSISDNLFNTDSLIEYVVKYRTNYSTSVFSETGTLIFSSPLPTSGSGSIPGLIKMNNTYYFYADSTIYSLPGSLPCSQCNSFPAGIIEPGAGTDGVNFNAYPNPFNNSLTVQYGFTTMPQNARLVISDILGREMQTLVLTKKVDSINLATSGFSNGTYVVSLYGDSGKPVSTKVIKIE